MTALRIGLRHHDPDWFYRLGRDTRAAVLAEHNMTINDENKRIETANRRALRGKSRGPLTFSQLVALPQVQATPEGLAFWGASQ